MEILFVLLHDTDPVHTYLHSPILSSNPNICITISSHA
jgi:hypothetical protein